MSTSAGLSYGQACPARLPLFSDCEYSNIVETAVENERVGAKRVYRGAFPVFSFPQKTRGGLMRCHIVADKAQIERRSCLILYYCRIVASDDISLLIIDDSDARPITRLFSITAITYRIVSLSVAAPAGKLGIFIPLPT